MWVAETPYKWGAYAAFFVVCFVLCFFEMASPPYAGIEEMNDFYQQNSVSIRYTSVIVAEVTFNINVLDSSINCFLNQLKLAFEELSSLIRHDMPMEKINEKAIQINSIIKLLMDATSKFDFKERQLFAIKLIESIAAVCREYEKIVDGNGFKCGLRDELVELCHKYFDNQIACNINAEDFWWELHFYKWLIKEHYIVEPPSRYSSHDEPDMDFTEKQLEDFFNKHRRKIIDSIIKRSQNSRLYVENPLDNNEKRNYLEAFKKLPQKTGS